MDNRSTIWYSRAATAIDDELPAILGVRVEALPVRVELNPRTRILQSVTFGAFMSEALHPVKPLGLFGVVAGQSEFEQLRSEILALAGALPEGERPAIARYLRDGAVIFALMSYSWDVVAGLPTDKVRRGQALLPGAVCGAFSVPGGLGIHSDGTYYWRADTADYVEHYGVGLPEDFLRHGRSLGWVARPMAPEDLLAVDRYLMAHARRLPPATGQHG